MSLAGPVSDIATEGPIPNRQTDVSANNGRRIIICAFILFSRRIVHSGSWKLKRARQRRPQRDQSRMSKAFLTHFMSNLGHPRCLTILRYGSLGIPTNQAPVGLEWQSIPFKW